MLVTSIIDASERRITPEGYMEVPAVFARSGIQTYPATELGIKDREPGATVRVWRPEDEVFSVEAMASFASKPITNDHPATLVTVDNVRDLAVGWTGEQVQRSGRLLRGSLRITDANAIRDLDSGKKQLSGGYQAEYEIGDGTNPDGEAYGAIQRNITGNHVALVERGRCGAECSVADSGGATMKTVTIGGKPVQVEDAVAVALEAAQMEAADSKALLDKLQPCTTTDGDPKARFKGKKDEGEEEAKKKLEDEEEAKKKLAAGDSGDRVERLEKELSEARAARDTLADKAMTPERLQKLVGDRVAVEKAASRLAPDFKVDGVLDHDIRLGVLKARGVEIADTDLEDTTYVRARFDALEEGGGESARFGARNLDQTHQLDTAAGGGSDKKTPREIAMDEQANAWKQKQEPERKAS